MTRSRTTAPLTPADCYICQTGDPCPVHRDDSEGEA